MPLVSAYIAVGSNLGDRLAQMRHALKLMEADGAVMVLQAGRVYENRAIGMGDAAAFLNTVIEVKTNLSARALLERCLKVEDSLGRERSGVWASRTIDLDLLLYGDARFSSETLTVPHPRMQDRDFVMLPLSDVAPNLVLGLATVAELAQGLQSDVIYPLEERIWTAPQIRIIAALAENGVIGVDGHLPWSIPEDWELFLKKTRGGTLIMGRQSFLEMMKEPSWSDAREYIVLSSHPEQLNIAGITVVSNLDAAMALAQQTLRPIWICGGASVYALALKLADQLHLTRIQGSFEGDTYFPKWQHLFKQKIASLASSDAGLSYQFEVYEQ